MRVAESHAMLHEVTACVAISVSQCVANQTACVAISTWHGALCICAGHDMYCLECLMDSGEKWLQTIFCFWLCFLSVFRISFSSTSLLHQQSLKTDCVLVLIEIPNFGEKEIFWKSWRSMASLRSAEMYIRPRKWMVLPSFLPFFNIHSSRINIGWTNKQRCVWKAAYAGSSATLLLLQPLRWCCVDCVIHHERDVREEQYHTYMWRE